MTVAPSKLANLRTAFHRLEAFLTEPVESDRDRAGVIQAFEFTFELVWKYLQARAQAESLSVATPRAALQFALRAGLIRVEDEAIWSQMLRDRNLSSHTYKEDLATAIFERIASRHVALLKELLAKM